MTARWTPPPAQPLVNLHVYGHPAPQGSKRHVGGGRMVEMSKYVGPWREAIVGEAQRTGVLGLQLDQPVEVHLWFYLPRPKGHLGADGLPKSSAPKYPTTTPDADKLIRSSLDALTQASIVVDDSRIVTIAAFKLYADRDNLPGARIQIWEAP